MQCLLNDHIPACCLLSLFLLSVGIGILLLFLCGLQQGLLIRQPRNLYVAGAYLLGHIVQIILGDRSSRDLISRCIICRQSGDVLVLLQKMFVVILRDLL